jgi:hypothetical protein
VVPMDKSGQSAADLADKGLFALWSKAGESSGSSKSGARSGSGPGEGALQDLARGGSGKVDSASDHESGSSIYAPSGVGKAGKASAAAPDPTSDYYGIPLGGAAVPV